MDPSVPIFQQTIGSLGLDVPPSGEARFEEIVQAYRAQLRPGEGPVHIHGMTNMAECRAAILAAGELKCGPVWVSWPCGEDGETAAHIHILAALFVAEGMGAAAFGLECAPENAPDLFSQLAACAKVSLFLVRDGAVTLWPYQRQERDPDSIPCASGSSPCFLSRTVDVGETLTCSPNLLEDIIAAEDDPVGAMKISILEPDDVDIFAQHQYAVRKALCLCSDVPELLESALRVYQGRAFYDGTGELDEAELARLSQLYGLIVL